MACNDKVIKENWHVKTTNGGNLMIRSASVNHGLFLLAENDC